MQTLRIFISSPGDVAEERDKARQVIASLQRQYGDEVQLIPVLWEDLPLGADASFQQGIDLVLNGPHAIDIAVFILWSRLGTPVGPPPKPDGTPYRSGTEREFDLMLAARQQSNGEHPHILAYLRKDEEGFKQRLTAAPVDRLEALVGQRKLAESFITEIFHDGEGHNIRAYHSYGEPVSFAQRLHTHLKQLLDTLLPASRTTATWTEAPYRSLEVFDIRHSPIFCGRDEETCDLLQRLRDQERNGCAFVCIVGASGSGKSSLARAGAAATLMLRSFDDGVKEWCAAVFLPSLAAGDLFLGLARTLAEPLPELRAGVGGIERFAKALEDGNHEAASILLETAFNQASRDHTSHHATTNQGSATKNQEPSLRALLVLDQMEELWTDRSITPEQREKFLQTTEALARGGRIGVLATLRSDFYPQAQLSEAFLRMKGERGQFDLTPPGTAALQELIVQPAHRAGLRFEQEPTTGRKLDQVILEDAVRDSSALPLLQYALAELYERRDEKQRLLTFAAYEAMGGVEGALGQRAAQAFDGLLDDAQAALAELLPLLISVDIAGEQNAVRRRAPLAELTSTPARRLLTERLIAACFLTTDEQSGTPIATLAHESLLRRWDRITTWINTNRDLLRMRARIEQYQAMWEESGRDESGRDLSRLLPAGLPLEEGRKLVGATTQMLDEKTKHFVFASAAHYDEQQRQATRRRRLAFAVLSGLLVVVMVAGVIALWMKIVADKATLRATNAQKGAEAQQRTTAAWLLKAEERNRISARTDLNIALDLIAKERSQDALAYLARASDYDPSSSLYPEVAVYWMNTNRDTMCVQLFAKNSHSDCADLSRDGARMVTVSNQSHDRGVAQVWDAFTGLPIGVAMVHVHEIQKVIFSPDARKVLTLANGRDVQVWDAATGQSTVEPMPQSSAVIHMLFSPDSTRIATANYDNTVRVLDATTGKPITGPMQHTDDVNCITFSPDSRQLATAVGTNEATAGYAQTWDAVTGKAVGAPMPHAGAVDCVNFSPDGTLLVTASEDKTARVWDVRTAQPLGEPIRNKKFGVIRATFSPDGTRIMTESVEGLAIWDAETRRNLLSTKHGPNEARFTADGQRISGVDVVYGFGVWSADTLRQHAVIESFELGGVEITPGLNGLSLVEVDVDGRTPGSGSLVLEHTAPAALSRRVILDFSGPVLGNSKPDSHHASSFSLDGTRFVSGIELHGSTQNHGAQVWDTSTGRASGVLLPHQQYLKSSSFSADGTKIVTLSGDNIVRVWDARSGEAIGEPLSQKTSARISPDGTRIVTANRDKTAQVWDAVTGHAMGGPLHNADDVSNACFSLDGAKIVTTSGRNIVQLWDAASGVAIGAPMQDEGFTEGASFSPDSTLVVTTGSKARIWNAMNGQPVCEPLGSTPFGSFSPDGRRLVTCVLGETRITDPLSCRPIFNSPIDSDNGCFTADGRQLMLFSRDQIIVWELLGNAGPPPRWFSDFLRLFARRRLTDEGRLEKYFPEAWRQQRAAITPLAMADTSRYGQIAQWYLLPDDQRPIRPGATTKAFTVADSLITFTSDIQQLRYAYDLNPDHPMIHLALAKFETNPRAATFLQRYDLDRLPKVPGKITAADLAKLWLRAAQWLLERPATERGEAVKAARQAAALAPDDSAIQAILEQLQTAKP